jgi:hypothetical protein
MSSRSQDDASIEVETIRLDDLSQSGIGSIALLKMDIEGWELHALRGMPLLLSSKELRAMFIELNVQALVRSGSQPMELLDLLKRSQFRLSMIDEAQKRLVPVDGEMEALISKKSASGEELSFNLLGLR